MRWYFIVLIIRLRVFARPNGSELSGIGLMPESALALAGD